MLARMWSNRNTTLVLVGVQTCTTIMEINLAVSQKTVGIDLSQDPAISLLGTYPKGTLSYHKGTAQL